MLKSSPTINYRERVEGTWGEFSTPTGTVSFIMTKARLGSSDVDDERRLTARLRPVREVLNVEQLDFNQLLQRDLDDHRVVEGLVPYLLKSKSPGPSFFPPIMTMLLPFSGEQPVDAFPRLDLQDVVNDPELGAHFQEMRYGDAFRARRLLGEDGKPHRIKFGRLEWNEEHAKLVVLDGQHRAMALLAIDRTVNKQWERTTGARFRHFYEARITELLKEAGGALDLNRVEIPVTVCWFPDLAATGQNPHKAARKLFVDVNKEARAPSESRLTLLSDTELLNIFTRSLLNRLRQDDPPLPLYAIEYDNPKREAWKPSKWTVLASLFLLKYAVQRVVFGPRESVTDMSAGISMTGRPNWSKMDASMRDQLDLKSLFKATIEDGERTIERDRIGNEYFPSRRTDEISLRFMEYWGNALLELLGGLRPYAVHTAALRHFKDNWLTDDAEASLARDALFEGVGTYWTILDSYNFWSENRNQARAQKLAEPAKTPIVKVWEIICEKEAAFTRLRAREYLGRKKEFSDADTERTSPDLQRAEELYRAANTNACQLGAILAFAALAHHMGKRGGDLVSFAGLLVRAWNAALESKRTQQESRLLVLASDKAIKHPINRIAKLDTPFAAHFRYFWLELLRLQAALDVLGPDFEKSVLDKLADEGRTHYARYLMTEQLKHVRAASTDPEATEDELREQAHNNVVGALGGALNHWFELSASDARDVVTTALAARSSAAPGDETDADASDGGEERTEEGAESEASADPSAEELASSVADDEVG